MSTELLTSRDALSPLEPGWNDLVQNAVRPNVFVTWEWITAWLDHFGGEAALRVLAVRRVPDGELVGIAPFVLRPQPAVGPTLWRELAFIGCTPTAPDHLDCIARPGWEGAVAAAAGAWLRNPPRNQAWDLIRMDGMTPASPLVHTVLGQARPGTTAAWKVICPYVQLPDSWESFEESLERSFRTNLRRRWRKLQREIPDPPAFTTVETEQGLAHALDALHRLHESVRRKNGDRTGAFDTPTKRLFYADVARRFAVRGWLRLHTLEVGGRPIAAALCFQFAGKAWFYQTGYDPELQPYGPGHFIVRHAIQRAIDEGAEELDMLRGEHPYKYDWQARPRYVLKVRVASSLTGGVVAPATAWLRAARNGWKEWRRAH
ncbi:MAG TPA: GNAT family N-acetyltransferase [Longimicrobiales bacterium]|nr:GNAT family N-acetyltransferase [Longimicrobiales bacterium]